MKGLEAARLSLRSQPTDITRNLRQYAMWKEAQID